MKQMKRYVSLCMAVVMVFVFSVATKNLSYVKATGNSTDVGSCTVLILDESGSMSGTPIEKQKEAAKVFVEKVLESNGENQIAIVGLNTKSTKKTDFTNDESELETKIDATRASGGTNINQALEVADNLLDAVSDDVQKNIVLCSDGLPESGAWEGTGKYTFADHPYYSNYGNACYNTAEQIKTKSYTIYTIGMFYDLSGTDFTFGKQLMEDLASPEKNGNGKLSFITDDMDKLIDIIFPEIIEVIVEPDEEPELEPDNTSPSAIDTNMAPHIILDQTSLTLLYDENTGERQTAQLTAQVFPSDYPNQEIEWYTDRDKVAEVEDGLVIAVDEGETVIHASLKGEDDVNGECKVTVNLVSDELAGDGTGDGIPGWYEITDFDEYDEGGVVVDNTTIEDISMSKDSLNITAGITKNLPLTIKPNNVGLGDVDIVFSSSDDTVAEVSENGTVEGLRPGVAVVSAAIKDTVNKRYVSANIQITVAPKKTAYTKVVGGNKKLGLTWKLLKAKDYVDGYQIQYSTNKNMSGAATKVINSRKSTGYTVNGLKNGKTYYTRIRTFHANGNQKIFSGWSKIKSAKIK